MLPNLLRLLLRILTLGLLDLISKKHLNNGSTPLSDAQISGSPLMTAEKPVPPISQLLKAGIVIAAGLLTAGGCGSAFSVRLSVPGLATLQIAVDAVRPSTQPAPTATESSLPTVTTVSAVPATEPSQP